MIAVGQLPSINLPCVTPESPYRPLRSQDRETGRKLRDTDTGQKIKYTERLGQIIFDAPIQTTPFVLLLTARIQYPLEEITIAGNLVTMFKGIAAVGNDMDLRSNIRCGSLLIDRMTIAGE